MGIIRFDARSTISGLNAAVNTWHVGTAGVPTTAEANAVLAPFKTFYDNIAVFRPTGATTSIGTRVLYFELAWWTKPVGKPGTPGYVKGFFNNPPLIVPATALTSTAGTGGGQSVPQLASVVSWKTNRAGRSYRGRTYLGPPGSTPVSGNQIAGASVTAINNAAAALPGAVAAVTVQGSGAALVVFSATKGSYDSVISGSSDAIWDTMRSRVK